MFKYKLLGLMVIFLLISSITPLSSAINISEQKTLEGFVISSLPPVNDELVEYFKAHNPDMNLMTLMAVYNAIMVQLTDEPGDVNPDIDDVNKQPKLKLTVFINYKTGNNSVIYKNRYTAKDLYQHSPGMKNFVDTVDNKIQHLSTMSNPELLKLCFVDDSEHKAMEILNTADTPKLTYLLDGSVDCLNLDDLSSNQLLVGDQVKEKAHKFFSKVCELNTKYDAGLTTDLENETIKLVDEASKYDPNYSITDTKGFIKLLDSYLGIDQKSVEIKTTMTSLAISGSICTTLGVALAGTTGALDMVGKYHNELVAALGESRGDPLCRIQRRLAIDTLRSKYIKPLLDDGKVIFGGYYDEYYPRARYISTITGEEGNAEDMIYEDSPLRREQYDKEESDIHDHYDKLRPKVEKAKELGLDNDEGSDSFYQKFKNSIVSIVLMIIGLVLLAVGVICLSIMGALKPAQESLKTVQNTLYIIISKNSPEFGIT
ncbi:MAG: hypothetical protein CfClM3_0446 [Methanobrevibacter sp. CfCl-M3]